MVANVGQPNTVWTNDASNISAVYNRNTSTWFESAKQAVAAASADDTLLIGGASFDVPGIIDARGLPLTFEARSDVTIAEDLMFLPGNGSNFISLDGDALNTYASSGRIIAPEDGQLIFNGLEFLDGSQFQQNGSSLLVNGQLATTGGVTYLSGEALAVGISTGINGVNRVANDTDIYSDYVNDGATIIQRGTLYIYGDLTNTGTMTGDFNNGFMGGAGPEEGDGYSIGGAYTIGSEASLVLPEPIWNLAVGGNLDIAINDPARFAMSEATIELNGLAPGNQQTMETLSADLGADEAGFDPSNFPIRTLRITSDSTTQVVNNHPNSTDDACEAIYVNELVVAAGGELITNGCPIYTHTATIDGTVDNLDDIIIIVDEPCQGDSDGDGVVGVLDLLAVIDEWGCTRNCSADFDGNGDVNIIDLLIVIQYWGVCPGN
ncbi:MAG: dockerin type I domain-containing protein [Phycisphaerales bacterium]|nr:dockerin type I domain-containing protein [Phycisphaerales bacterium]